MAQRVIGTNPSNNNPERLATQADQLIGNGSLASIYYSVGSSVGSNLALIAGGMSSKINLTDYKKAGMLSAFAGADENGRTISTLEAQSNTYITYSLTEGDINREISIDYNIDPSTYTYTQISKIIISGYNNSAIPLEFKFFLYNQKLNRYNVFYKKVFDIASDPTIGQSAQDVIQFILPAPIGDWDRDYNRFGYFTIETDPSEASFKIDVIIYQRNYLVE